MAFSTFLFLKQMNGFLGVGPASATDPYALFNHRDILEVVLASLDIKELFEPCFLSRVESRVSNCAASTLTHSPAAVRSL